MAWRVGIDIGGTFTDFALYDDRARRLAIGKWLTTPHDPAEGAVDGLAKLLGLHAIGAPDVDEILHATTLVTNVLLERKGAKTALLITAGFGDTLEIGRQKRWDTYDLSVDRPRPLIPRSLVFEVPERIGADGCIVTPLDEHAVRAIANDLVREGVAAVAVCLLHSYRNAEHERRIAAVLEQEAPSILVSLSSDVSPTWREYERATTTAVNAYVRPAAGTYVRRMIDGLRRLQYDGELRIFQSNGGLVSVDVAEQHPVRTLESGPAAGAIMAGFYGRLTGDTDLISFDMGGTTAKCCIVERGEFPLRGEFEADKIGLKPRSGIPITVPSVDVLEIGAGGGSIARAKLGVIVVGPDSAGADPGPACYGRGGREPTVTDADLVLGYLDPASFAGGSIGLDVNAAASAIREGIAVPLGIDVTQAAWGIHELVNLNMENAARAILAEKGADPRDHTFIALGGAGPAHAARIAAGLGCRKAIFPAAAGAASAIGLLTVENRFDFARTSLLRLDPTALPTLNALFERMLEEARGLLSGEIREVRVARSADLRYSGQGYEITVPIPQWPPTNGHLEELADAFVAAYERRFGYRDNEAAIQGLTWRLSVSTRQPDLVLQRRSLGAVREAPPSARRKAFWPEDGGYVDTAIYDRYDLRPGETLRGPAIVEEHESTTVLPPASTATVDEWLNVIVSL